MLRTRKLLVCGPHKSGKTALIRRFVDGLWVPSPTPTVGLDQVAGRASITLANEEIIDELRAVLPPDGVELEIWEIGGKAGHLRGVPRGSPIDGLLLCYDPCDRASFQNAAHLLLQHRADRHLEHHSAAVVAPAAPLPRLAVVLCGTKRDGIDAGRPQAVGAHEAEAFAEANGIKRTLLASSKTGEHVLDAFQALTAAVLEAEEDAEAEAAVLGAQAVQDVDAVHTWALHCSGAGASEASMTSPKGERPHEPHHGEPPSRLVEVVNTHGEPFSARPLRICLERGLLHRAVHVWFCDSLTGGLLLRKYAPDAPKNPCRWGPSCHGEVFCYGSTGNERTGPHTSEISSASAVRIMREQFGVDQPQGRFEHWFSCKSRVGQCHELLDVFVTDLMSGGLPPLCLSQHEEVEWVHFLDVFGSASDGASSLFHIPEIYRSSMTQMMRSRILHAHEGTNYPSAGLAHGRPNCPLPIAT